ncbi:uncharacterized protein METZ01_LOCUS448261, partial [marine metagenome]
MTDNSSVLGELRRPTFPGPAGNGSEELLEILG